MITEHALPSAGKELKTRTAFPNLGHIYSDTQGTAEVPERSSREAELSDILSSDLCLLLQGNPPLKCMGRGWRSRAGAWRATLWGLARLGG